MLGKVSKFLFFAKERREENLTIDSSLSERKEPFAALLRCLKKGRRQREIYDRNIKRVKLN